MGFTDSPCDAADGEPEIMDVEEEGPATADKVDGESGVPTVGGSGGSGEGERLSRLAEEFPNATAFFDPVAGAGAMGLWWWLPTPPLVVALGPNCAFVVPDEFSLAWGGFAPLELVGDDS